MVILNLVHGKQVCLLMVILLMVSLESIKNNIYFMKSFKLIREQNEILNKLSNKDKHLKEILIKDIDAKSIDELKEILDINKKALEANGKVTFPLLQTMDDKIKFFMSNSDLIDAALEDTDWFSTTPAQSNIQSSKLWLTTTVDKAVLEVIKTILNEI